MRAGSVLGPIVTKVLGKDLLNKCLKMAQILQSCNLANTSVHVMAVSGGTAGS